MSPTIALVLILARELGENMATPMFLIDPEGVLVFYNEPAEELLGQTFADTGPLGPDEWGTHWLPEDLQGRPLTPAELPLTIALTEKRPAHSPMRITGSDGHKRSIAVTAVPLFARKDDFVGAVAIFWQDGRP
jgi:PAS domain-containing protein